MLRSAGVYLLSGRSRSWRKSKRALGPQSIINFDMGSVPLRISERSRLAEPWKIHSLSTFF